MQLKISVCEAIMDELLLFNCSHTAKLEELLKALLKNGLKISLKKCQLYRTNLNYMDNEICIKDKRVCVKPLRNRLGVIQKLQPPTTVKGCRRFAGIGEFHEYVLPRTVKIIETIYDLPRKGRPFV